jgi:2-C-methyl-D-erythritol 4-phosphate cytidylyltransferase / 2-C-methyl-D-erythritol 2,4-cyclodiphosphate synthase
VTGTPPGRDVQASHGTVRADAIVVAAGASRRMGDVDKLACLVAGRPLLAWTLDALGAAPEVERIIVVTAASRVGGIQDAPWLPGSVVGVVAGGDRRQESVAAGLAALEALDAASERSATAVAPGARAAPTSELGARIVLVHDGARPCVSPALVSAVAQAAARHGAAIPVLPVTETLKRVVDGRIEGTVDRETVAAAQTPQGLRRELLQAAIASRPADDPETWTDEAALLEACRIAVHAIPGEASNLKVTLPGDLARAELTLLGGLPAQRVGFGHDSHPFGPGSPLVLGGVEFEGAPRLHGHSDGDVVLHAVADALLGAGGLGDLGRLFPADARTPRGIDSTELLRTVVRRLAERSLAPTGLDVTIIAARPRLAGRLDLMGGTIAAILGVSASVVNVKASTGNLDGSEGAGRGISAHAVASVGPVR